MKSVSVIVPSYNSFQTVGHTLEGILRQPTEYLRETIVVDSSDDERTAELLKTYATRGVKIIRLSAKTIPATARNEGAKQARGKILAFIDADAFPEKNWLQTIVAAYESGIRVGGGSIHVAHSQRQNLWAIAQHALQFNEFTDEGRRRQKIFVPACNFFCEKRLFDAVGGFPELRGSEDVLLGLNLKKFAPVIFDPDIRVYHIFRQSITAIIANQALWGKYVLIYRRDRLPNVIYWGFLPVLVMPGILLIKYFRMLCRIARRKRWSQIAGFLLVWPLVSFGLLCWGVGFASGAWSKERNAWRSQR